MKIYLCQMCSDSYYGMPELVKAFSSKEKSDVFVEKLVKASRLYRKLQKRLYNKLPKITANWQTKSQAEEYNRQSKIFDTVGKENAKVEERFVRRVNKVLGSEISSHIFDTCSYMLNNGEEPIYAVEVEVEGLHIKE